LSYKKSRLTRDDSLGPCLLFSECKGKTSIWALLSCRVGFSLEFETFPRNLAFEMPEKSETHKREQAKKRILRKTQNTVTEYENRYETMKIHLKLEKR
jgi:hypothetical protein